MVLLKANKSNLSTIPPWQTISLERSYRKTVTSGKKPF